MKTVGIIKEIIKHPLDGKYRITLITEDADGADELYGLVDIDIHKPVRQRSLDSNAYFHVLIEKNYL